MSEQLRTTEIDDQMALCGAEIVTVAEAGLLRRSARSLQHAWQRGMATAEYAVGILAAVALALVLLRIFTNADFFATLLKFVVSLIGKVSGMLP